MTPGQRLVRRREAAALRARLQQAIEAMATKFAMRIPWMDAEDLVVEGWLGALKAMDSYDRSRATWLSWVTDGAWGAMMHLLRYEAKLRGIPGWKWEAREGRLREVPLDEARAVGRRSEAGLADQVAGEHLAELFVASLSGTDRRIAEAIANGAGTLCKACDAVGLSKGNSSWYRPRLRRKLGDLLLRGKHREGLVL